MDERQRELSKGLYQPDFEHDSCGIGMIVDIKGRASHRLVTDAIEILERLTHRGGVGYEPDTGDGAGILLQIPDGFMRRAAHLSGFDLPAGEKSYGVAMMFASPDQQRRTTTLSRFSDVVASLGLEVLGVREVPVSVSCIGKTAASVRPSIVQVFIGKGGEELSDAEFERSLYLIAKQAHNRIRAREHDADPYFYLASCSASTIVYKGMLLPLQLSGFYLDLKDKEMTSAIALVHSRFSTNTFPSWERAHPMHHIIHNGEINTIRGNVNWVRAREARMASKAFGERLSLAFPVINEDGSDSAMLDDFLSLLLNSGLTLQEAVMMAIPEPWEENTAMAPEVRSMYEYNSCLVEPWDGPASVAFTDGRFAGATLDRNGLRPSRYYVTADGRLILSSEVGVLPLAANRIVRKDRLRPGRMLLIDTQEGRIIEDEELKRNAAAAQPYQRWLAENLVRLSDIEIQSLSGEGGASGGTGEDGGGGAVGASSSTTLSAEQLLVQQKAFGYSWEDLSLTLCAIATSADDPIAAMGYDAPLAVLSRRPQLLYNYFKQLFAQVTNPPIDTIREHLVTSSIIHLGAEGNLLQPDAANCRLISHDTPVLSAEDMARLRSSRGRGLEVAEIAILFNPAIDGGMEYALEQVFAAADAAREQGRTILVLSDRGVDAQHAAIPALLAVAGLHHHMVRHGTRTQISIVLESGEPREVHHHALLVGYGADAIYPYLAYASIDQLSDLGIVTTDAAQARANYRQALTNGIIKVMSKMGISTVRSYHGAQIFEALGVSADVIDRYFTGTATRIGGIILADIEREARARHQTAFAPDAAQSPLEPGGEYRWRNDGEPHLLNPKSVFYLQQSVRSDDYALFKKFSADINDHSRDHKNLRSLLEIVTVEKPIPVEEVEPIENIVRRFKTGAMSFGSISQEAHECMAIAMNRLGAKSNSGEGGEAPQRYVIGADGLNRSSSVKQVASGRFGVTINYLNHCTEIQIKMAQGAKPGEGGHLPGTKVYPWVAKNRFSTPGVELISPPPHHDIYSIEDLAQLIHDLKNANRDARVNVKLVSEAGVGTIAVGVAKGLADAIVISGFDGGTGAAARTSIRHAGLPWELGVAETHQSLVANKLRDRVVLETDGKLFCGRDIVIAALLGAEEFTFATAPLIAMGCDMMRVCNQDTCPVGIATQNPELRRKFQGKPEHIERYMRFVAQEVREWMARMAVRSFDE
ncbi:MAG: glutamate synthase large subunit, partial [Coriobacteriales bacterium]|nr:glutamate synthase large subunit [Coriobacteriales bacterium]